jgi:hypothetical protein
VPANRCQGGQLSYRKSLDPLPLKERIARKISTAVTLRANRLIVFLTPGYDKPAGGILSIAALYRESAALRHLHHSRVALCTIPGDPHLPRYTWFENRDHILDLNAVLRRRGRLEYLLLHIPEYAVGEMTRWLTSASETLLRGVRELHLNVMVQNIDLVDGEHVRGLARFGKVTCTTAHEAYTNLSTREALGVTLHRLSVYLGPELYPRSGHEKKEPLLIVSHDEHPLKERVLRQIAEALPGLEIRVIRNITYENYRGLLRRAKWSLTFGEGLDGYFAEPVFSGGVSFAVFNDRFFTPSFSRLETVYPSWDALMDRIAADLKRLDNPTSYNRCWRQAYDLLCELYSTERLRENLRMFYRGEYTFP